MTLRQLLALSIALLLAALMPSLAQPSRRVGTVSERVPETVMVTFHAKPGAEADLAKVIANHWTTAQKLKLVTATPHLTLRGTEDTNKIYFVEIFSWRNASIPDSAPPAITAIWDQMNALVEPRGGKSGLDFVPVEPVR